MMHGRRSWKAAVALAVLAGCGSTVEVLKGSTGGGGTTGSAGGGSTVGSTGGGGTGGGTTMAGGTGGGAGPAGVLAMLDDEPVTLAVIGDDVYVGFAFDGIVSIPTAGGTVTPIVPSVGSGEIQNAFVFDQNNLYWDESSGGDTSGPIASVPVVGGQATVLASSKGFTAGIAVNADSVYWVDQDQGTVSRVPIGGGSASALAVGLTTPGGLVLHASTLYLTDAAGDLLSVPADGGSATTLFTGPGIPPNVEVADYSPAVVADDANVYFVVCHWEGGGETIYRYPLDGSGAPEVLVTAPVSQCATALAVDATELYWADGASIMAVPLAGGTPRTVATSSQAVVAGPAVDKENVYWGITPDTVMCGLCPPPPKGQINAIMRAPKSAP
jgi:hypothetical protein